MASRRREMTLLFGALGSFFFSLSMLLPTLPLYVRDLGGSPVEVGLVMGVFSLGVLAARPVVGRAIDTRGHRFLIVVGSLLVVAVAPLYLAFSTVVALVLIRIVHGAGLSAFTTATTTMAADLAPPERRTEFLGWISTSSILAFAVGPPIGIALAERAGYRALFLAVGGAAALSAFLGALLTPCPRDEDEPGPMNYRAAILRREVIVPTLTLLLVTLAHGGTFTFLPILLEERLAFNLGFFFLAYSVASLLVRIFAGRLSRGVGDGPMVWGGLALYAVGMALLPRVDDLPSMLIAALFFGAGFGIYQPAVYGLVANVATDRTRGMVFSFFLAAFDLGIALGGLVAGPVVARAGIPALLYGLAIVPLAAGALFVRALGWRPRASAGLATPVAGSVGTP
ncbi:MAG TPA: MFS transporter [Gemmatimonadota bacterium]|nr:MFS transporter [Gemmatimonadota bacterium]